MPENLWSFAVRAYGLPDVAAQCLRWQSDFDADINLLLAGLWLARARRCWSAEDVAALRAHVQVWRAFAIAPLRTTRVALAASALYPALKAVELQAERVQIAMIERWVTNRDMPVADVALLDGAHRNLQIYAATLAVQPDDAAIEPLFDAVSIAVARGLSAP